MNSMQQVTLPSSDETRSQLKTVYDKTGTNRQADLVRLALAAARSRTAFSRLAPSKV